MQHVVDDEPMYQPYQPQHIEDETPVGLIVAGYVLAVLIPLVGFILGIVAITRRNRTARSNGVGIVVTSVVAFVVWIAVFTSAIHHEQQRLEAAPAVVLAR
jgi:hypothetical protein